MISRVTSLTNIHFFNEIPQNLTLKPNPCYTDDGQWNGLLGQREFLWRSLFASGQKSEASRSHPNLKGVSSKKQTNKRRQTAELPWQGSECQVGVSLHPQGLSHKMRPQPHTRESKQGVFVQTLTAKMILCLTMERHHRVNRKVTGLEFRLGSIFYKDKGWLTKSFSDSRPFTLLVKCAGYTHFLPIGKSSQSPELSSSWEGKMELLPKIRGPCSQWAGGDCVEPGDLRALNINML